jgi:hypothetical protein
MKLIDDKISSLAIEYARELIKNSQTNGELELAQALSLCTNLDVVVNNEAT